MTIDEKTCLDSGVCQVVDRQIYLRPYLSIVPEYTMELRSDLGGDGVKATDLAKELQTISGVTVLHTFDVPGFQAVTFTGDPGPTFLNDERFVDYDGIKLDSKAELDEYSGHVAQVAISDNGSEQLKSSQVLPTGIQRTIMKPTVNSTDVDIAILDTGVSLSHPDLNVYNDTTFINGTINGDDDNSHGSIVVGIAAAKDNDIGIAGTAPGARIWSIKVCDFQGECKISNQMKGVEYAIKHANEIDVINLSTENRNSPALNRIIDEAIKAGITVVVAAGNQGEDASKTSPANNPNVITVSAIGDSDGICGGEGPESRHSIRNSSG